MTDETYVVPCESPENDPEDWFIEKDGRQYPDDILYDPSTFEPSYDHLNGFTEPPDEFEIEEIEKAMVAEALVRRRHARDKCHTECYFRLQCLSIALGDTHPTHGTWGGYYPEQLKQIRKLRDDRQRRESQDADVGSEE